MGRAGPRAVGPPGRHARRGACLTPAGAEELASTVALLTRPAGTTGWAVATGAEVTGAWLPLARLAEQDRWAPVAARVSARLGSAERRVADSLLLMGLAARLWYATLVPAAAGDALLDPGCLLVTDDQGALRLGVTEPAGWSGASARQVADVVVAALEPVVHATRLAPGLSWGNIASALLGLRGVADGVSGWVVEALTHDRLVGTTSAGGRRRSCCLFYRVPGGGLCADCCLDRVPARD